MTAIFTNRKSVVLFSGAALIIPVLHSAIFVDSFYSSQYRNSLNHIAFLVAVSCMVMVCVASLLTPDYGEDIPK